MDLKYAEEMVFFATLKIDAMDPKTGQTSTGTGFLFQHPLPGFDDRTVVVLITCRHVLFGEDGVITVKLHGRDDARPNYPDLGKPGRGCWNRNPVPVLV